MVRITQNMLTDRVLVNLQNNLNRMSELQQKVSTGQRISSPSDNPIDFTLSLGHRYNISQGRSFQRNLNGARTNLEITESTMGSLTETLQDIRGLTIQGLNDTDPDGRLAISMQVRELYQQVLDLANSNYNGRYIFGGSSTKDMAFTLEGDAIKYNGDDFEQNVLIGKDSKIISNLHGYETFLHTPNQITGSVKIDDIAAPLAQQLKSINPDFPNLPDLPEPLSGATVERSPNPNNSPTALPNNYATFYVNNTEIKVDLAVDSLEDVKDRINANVNNVVAEINGKNQLVITSKRSDALVLEDGDKNIGFEPDKPQQANLLGALGMHRIVYSSRSLTSGFPATDPLVDGTVLPTPARGTVALEDKSFLFVATETGPADEVAVPFGDNLAITDVDENGNEKVDASDNPVFVDKLEALRITIDDEIVDLDLRSLTEGIDFNGIAGDFDDLPGSTLGDLYDVIKNHPQLQGKVTAYTNKDGYGIELSAIESLDQFKVENVRKLFGRDITTRVTIDGLGDRTVTREDTISRDTKLEDLPGAMIDPAANEGSLGIRGADPMPAGVAPSLNKGLVVVKNGDYTEAVDLRDAETIGDVIDRINESNTGVEVSINDWGTGLELESIVPGDGELSLTDMDEGTIAKDLGFFGTPPPARIQSDPAAGITLASTIGAGPLAGVSDGEFEIEVRDGNGVTLDTYTIEIATGDTIQDIVDQIDAVDGKSGPGGGLISANFDTVNGIMNINNNYNGNTLFIDPANDTTGGTFTDVIGIDQYTAVTEANALTYGDSVSNQNTASVLGVEDEGQINEKEEKNLFRTLSNLEEGLRNDETEIIKDALSDLDLDMDVILNDRTKLGARLNRVEAETNRLQENEDFSRQELSYLEDADFAELVTDLSLAETALNASLTAGARVMQQTLLDFLR